MLGPHREDRGQCDGGYEVQGSHPQGEGGHSITMLTVTVQLNGIMRVRWMEMESGSTIPYEGVYLQLGQLRLNPPDMAQSAVSG